ncbi:Hypothetical predicted protein [Paramuricea clavata]|uniref:Uncharacterized protein n=1 Tax=Paramuricea clavata TaxID=317549 RepID=A0A6S7JFJ6_PARCT|nr:Hypothetical predicted protein [Paramuricea clavata]
MAIAIAVIIRLIHVIHYLMNGHFPPVDDIIIDGQVNNNALGSLRNILTQTRRDDVLELLYKTMAGDTSVLERHERNIHDILNQFYIDRDDDIWPVWCYLFTRENNPQRQETSGYRGRTENGNIVSSDTEDATQNNGRYRLQQESNGHRGCLIENGNIVVSDTEGATQNNERYTHRRRDDIYTEGTTQNNERYRDVETRSLDQDLSHPSARRPRDPQTSKPQANQKEPPLLVLDDRALRSFQMSSQEAVLPEQSIPLGNPPRCNTCAKTTKIKQTSRLVWSNVRGIIEELNPQQLQDFIAELNKCDEGILGAIQFHDHGALTHEIVDALQRYHLSGERCILCLLNYVFHRIGRSDLTNSVKGIPPSLE